jgi:hypothetical protein
MQSQMARDIKKQYSDLARQLKLSPQETEQVMALLADHATSMLGDGNPFEFLQAANDEAAMKKLTEKSEALDKEYEAKLKTVLGEEKFKALKEYEGTIGERQALADTYAPHLADAGVPLQAEQRDQLLGIMLAERKKSPPSPFDEHAKPEVALRALTDDSSLKDEQDYQRRVLQAAPRVLSPEQVNALQDAFKESTETQELIMKMTRTMAKKPEAPAPAPAPTKP